ncbi:MAG: autotransporter domain-containing protein [Sphingomicrobium sp.]
MNHRRIARALACVSLSSISALATPAAAQQIDRIVVFGDSYADIGNALRLGNISPISTQIYTTGRFSGGSNYIDTLSSTFQVPQFNFAIGGARTNNGNQTAGLPGLTFEVQQFLAGGGALGFPTVDTALDRSDLVAVSIGGNDARNYQQTGGTLTGASTAAATAVTSFRQNFDLVMARGTPTISFLAGDTGLLPEIANNPNGAAVRTAFSTAFNTGVQQVLSGYAAQGSIVHYLDLTTMLGQVNANLSAFGLQGITCPALPNTTCVTNNAAPFLFYVDNLHPTSVGMEIIGRYVAAQLRAPLTLQAPSDLGFDTAREWGRTLSTRGDLYRGDKAPGFRVFAVADGFSRHADNTEFTTAYDAHGLGVTIGAEYGMGAGLVGLAGNYSKPKLTFGNDAARLHSHSWQIGAYGSFDAGGFFGQGYLGYGKDNNRLDRVGVVSDLESSPDGNHTIAGIKAGYLMPFAGMGAGPIVAFDYARAKADSYTESGDAALALNVGPQSLKSLTGQFGIEVRGTLAGLHPFADLTAERDFTGDDRLITFSQTTAPTILNTWGLPRSKETYGRFTAGGSANVFGEVNIDASVSTTFGRDFGEEVSGNVGVNARF